MNYLITAAGHGSRFISEGIKPPKPLIRALGKEMLLWSLSSFAIGPGDSLYIVTLKSHRVPQCVDKILRFVYPDTSINWLELHEVLPGQLCTTVQALHHFNLTGPFIVHNCDTYHDATKLSLESMLSDQSCFGVIPCFKGAGDHWSFVRTSVEDPDLAVEVSEKRRISENCSVGTYAFAEAKYVLDMADIYFAAHSSSSTEFYIAPFYQFAIEHGNTVRICSAQTTRLFGTPSELRSTFELNIFQLLAENAWDAHQRGTLVVDIDGTLCHGPTEGDYSKVNAIEDVCAALRKAHQSGFYIVLFTARNMRTFKGSLGLINRFTAPVLLNWLEENDIPFDEIYYGKPWGPLVSYVDDKSVSIESFVVHHT
jgi:capsule biosynthesis phosphatase